MHVYFKSISLKNVRCFGKKQTIDFTDEDGNAGMWNLILGENGTGKTSILKSLASYFIFAAIKPDYTSIPWNIDTDYLIRDKSNPAQLGFGLEEWIGGKRFENTKSEMDFDFTGQFNVRGTDTLLHTKQGVFFAYGASRRIGISGVTDYQGAAFANLIDENQPLLNAEEWLAQADYLALKDKSQTNRFEQVKVLLLRLFRGEISDIKIETTGSNSKKISVLFKTNYGWVTLHQLSLGYKTLLAWMVDFAGGLLERYPDSANPLAEPAVCLVDEIDLHLHPRFQRKMIGFLSDIFPKTQFIVTAHSPLVVQAAADVGANIILLERKGDEVVVNSDPKIVQNWRIDQVLTSDLFGLDTTLSPDADKKMERRRSLLRKDLRTEKEEAELTKLGSEFDILPPEETLLGQQLVEHLKKLQAASPV